MARRTSRPEATYEKILTPLKEICEQCGQLLWVSNHNHRTVTTLSGVWKLTLVVRQCIQPSCHNYHRRQRPEEEGGWALPHSEFGLDMLVLIGLAHFQGRFSGSEIYQRLKAKGITIAQRSVTNLIHRYEEMMTWSPERIKAKLQQQKSAILVIDRLEFDVAYQPLVIVRDCLSSEVLFARCCLNEDYLCFFLNDVKNLLRRLSVPVKSLIFNSDETAILQAHTIFRKVPRTFHQFHYYPTSFSPTTKQIHVPQTLARIVL